MIANPRGNAPGYHGVIDGFGTVHDVEPGAI